MKKRFMGVVKNYLEACVIGDTRERCYCLGWLQGMASAAFWSDKIDDYEFYVSEISKAISLAGELCAKVQADNKTF